MSRFKIRCFGGFEVWRQNQQVQGFESQKVRALLAYLVRHGDRVVSRDQLAEMLWPERSDEAARRNLRQAVYNLKNTLAAEGAPAAVLTQRQQVQLNPELDIWLDVDAFESGVEAGLDAEGGFDLQELARAAQLYRGDFLAGFNVRDSIAFEDWLLGEQESLREMALTALRTLVESYLRRGELRVGIQYGLRLVRLDPLAEEGHRQLMKLFALSGQRSRALAQYEELRNTLNQELGIDPVQKSRELYERILVETEEEPAASSELAPIGPLVQLAGREEHLQRLADVWGEVCEGEGQMTLVSGESGIGKSRLIKSFLDTATARRRTTVLRGRCYGLGPSIPYQPVNEVVAAALRHESNPTLTQQHWRTLKAILLKRRSPTRAQATVQPADLATALVSLLGELIQAENQPPDGLPDHTPVVLYLDDLHWADLASCELLELLLPAIARLPVWLLASADLLQLDASHPLRSLVTHGAGGRGHIDRLHLDRLDRQALSEISSSLLGEDQAGELTDFLDQHGGGLPLHTVELINSLWDEEVLASRDGDWSLARPLSELAMPPEANLDWLILRRVRRLPTSTRRLIALAAVMGLRFEADLLRDAGDEHIMVVEVGIEVMLGRWLVRQFARDWSDGRRERDIVLWAGGVRRGAFEFAHEAIRRAIYEDVNPLRRQAMHRQVADALEKLRGEDSGAIAEELAEHLTRGGVWRRAFPYLVQAAERARTLCAHHSAQRCYSLAREAAGRALSEAVRKDDQEHWRSERERLGELLAEIAGRASAPGD